MGCASCGAAKTAKPAEPYVYTAPDGVKTTVKNASEERTARDQYWVRERARARQKGYRVQR